MELEFALETASATDEAYDLPLRAQHAPLLLDWAPMIEALLADRQRAFPQRESPLGSTTPSLKALLLLPARWASPASHFPADASRTVT